MQLQTTRDPWRRQTRVMLPSLGPRRHTLQPLQFQRLADRRHGVSLTCLVPWRRILRQCVRQRQPGGSLGRGAVASRPPPHGQGPQGRQSGLQGRQSDKSALRGGGPFSNALSCAIHRSKTPNQPAPPPRRRTVPRPRRPRNSAQTMSLYARDPNRWRWIRGTLFVFFCLE